MKGNNRILPPASKPVQRYLVHQINRLERREYLTDEEKEELRKLHKELGQHELIDEGKTNFI